MIIRLHRCHYLFLGKINKTLKKDGTARDIGSSCVWVSICVCEIVRD